jgi:hypothetical protein
VGEEGRRGDGRGALGGVPGALRFKGIASSSSILGTRNRVVNRLQISGNSEQGRLF